MKIFKKIAACMSVVLVLMMLFTATAYAAGDANVAFSSNEDVEYAPGDKFMVTVTQDEMTVSSFVLGLRFDTEKLTVTRILWGKLSFYDADWEMTDEKTNSVAATAAEANSNGSAGATFAGSGDVTYYANSAIIKIQFQVKDSATGSTDITLFEKSDGADGFIGDVDTLTVKIKGTTPSCEHTSTMLVLNSDGTHNVVCDNAECGQTVTPNVTCTVDETKTTEYELRAADCCSSGLKQVIKYCACQYMISNDTDVVIPATGKHTLVKYEKAATCVSSGYKEYWECNNTTWCYEDADGQKEIDDISAWMAEGGDGYLPVDPTNHEGEIKYVDNGDNTHNATYDCCGTSFVTNEAHSYKDADTCICGAVKAPEHVCVHDHYYRTETTHQSVCSCGEKIGEAEPHNYKTGTTEHICICGVVETFTLTVKDMPAAYSGTGTPDKTFTVPYGTNILAYIQEQIDLGNVDMRNQTVNDETRIGTYIFDGDWRNLSAGWGVVKEDSIVSGDTEITVGADFTGWSRASEDNTWGYEVKGAPVFGWYEIDGNWYYFFKNEESRYSFRAEGLARVPYPTVEIMGNTYAPNAADIAYAASKGREFIDATEAWFYFGDDGKFAYDSKGYISHGDSQGKLINGMLPWHIGLVEVAEGEYRYFAGDLVNGGNVIATGKIYVSRNTTDLDVVIGGIYLFDEDGAMVIGDGITDVNGVLYYLDENRVAIEAGLIEIDGNYYYVRSGGDSAKAGQVVVGRKYWVSDTNGYFAAGMYTFDKDGKMIIGAASGGREGIVEIDGVLYYYVGGVKQVGAGVVEMTDELGETFYIYVKSDGTLATGEYWPTTTNGLLERGCYDWGTDGRYYPAN